MNISIINGSPKLGKSTSELLIGYLVPQLFGHTVEIYHINRAGLMEAQMLKVADSDALIFVFPLYIDSFPSHLLRLLMDLEKQRFSSRSTVMYCLVNNGFYEGTQNIIAVEQMKAWCDAAGLTWGMAVGIGAGEMLPSVASVPLGHGPNKNLGCALKELAHHVLSSQSGPDRFISPNWPRFLWKIDASIFCWYPRAKANGLNRKRMLQRAGPV